MSPSDHPGGRVPLSALKARFLHTEECEWAFTFGAACSPSEPGCQVQ